MSLVSMTGFGRGLAADADWRVEVELSSVNRKQLDISLSLPRNLVSLESRLVAVIHARISRGYVKGAIRVQRAAEAPAFDAGRLAARVAQIRALAAELGMEDDLAASDLVALLSAEDPSASGPDAFQSAAPDPALAALLEQATARAANELDASRRAEGARLETDLRARLAALHARLPEFRAHAAGVAAAWRAALLRRIAEAALPIPADDPAVAREVALFADKCDVQEELTRLESHFAQADALLDGDEPCGRALDFLCQEFFREANTLGSKSNCAPLTALVVAFKADLEAFREQVQNIA